MGVRGTEKCLPIVGSLLPFQDIRQNFVDAATRLTNRANDTCGLQAMLGCCLDIAVGLGQFEIAVDQSPGGNARHLGFCVPHLARSEEHTSELQSLMRISYAVFCLKKKKKHQ